VVVTAMPKAVGAAAFLLGLLVAVHASGQLQNIDVPDKLKPPANEAPTLMLSAKGVQIYECRAKADQAGAYEWTFVAPEAELFDVHGSKAGHHYAGPHWESRDGSKIVGTVKERADAAEAGAIPWLLLTAKSVGPEGTLSKITSVQRINTAGGVAPKSGCSSATAGRQVRVDYTADYYFFAAR
jgi:Protein of unknown function (DUF3455)